MSLHTTSPASINNIFDTMSRIYISSSWQNKYQPQLVEILRNKGHKVYDFRHPEGRTDKNVWESLHVNQENVTNKDFVELLSEVEPNIRFKEHYNAMLDADTCILLLPCGRSSHIEAGYMKGLGKRVLVYNPDGTTKPELMYLTLNGYVSSEEELHQFLEPIKGICKVCGCSAHNPCWNPVHGYCWWVDETETLCSHCAHLEAEGEYCIADDPSTEHCIKDVGNAFK